MATKKNTIKIKASKANLLDEFTLNREAVAQELADCFVSGDLESFQEIMSAFVHASNKKKLSEKSKLSRDTIYRAGRGENISIESAFKILHAG